MSSTLITDQGLKELPLLTLIILNLNDTKVTDEGLKKSHRVLFDLTSLALRATMITDEGIKELESIRLTALDLQLTGVSDESIEVLGKISTLQELNLSQTKVTAEGIRKLKVLLPDCKIVWP